MRPPVELVRPPVPHRPRGNGRTCGRRWLRPRGESWAPEGSSSTGSVKTTVASRHFFPDVGTLHVVERVERDPPDMNWRVAEDEVRKSVRLPSLEAEVLPERRRSREPHWAARTRGAADSGTGSPSGSMRRERKEQTPSGSPGTEKQSARVPQDPGMDGGPRSRSCDPPLRPAGPGSGKRRPAQQ